MPMPFMRSLARRCPNVFALQRFQNFFLEHWRSFWRDYCFPKLGAVVRAVILC